MKEIYSFFLFSLMILATISGAMAADDPPNIDVDCGSGDAVCKESTLDDEFKEVTDWGLGFVRDYRKDRDRQNTIIWAYEPRISNTESAVTDFKVNEAAYLKDDVGGGISLGTVIEYLTDKYLPFLKTVFVEKSDFEEYQDKLDYLNAKFELGKSRESTDYWMFVCQERARQQGFKYKMNEWTCYPDGLILTTN